MLYSVQFYIVFALFASATYWLVPGNWPRARYSVLIGGSLLVVFSAFPYSALFAAGMGVCAWGLCRILSSMPNPRLHFAAGCAVLVPLIVVSIAAPLDAAIGSAATLISFGMSFYTLKLYASMRLAWKGVPCPLPAFLANVLFFPAYPAGPIDSHDRFRHEVITAAFNWRDYGAGLLRFGTGIAKLYPLTMLVNEALAEVIVTPRGAAIVWGEVPAYLVYAWCLVKFVGLYVNFSGYTDVALGIARMFGLQLSENFRNPLAAHNIQNFWQRWHLSLSGFVSRHMFLPMVRRHGHPSVCVVIVFALIGLWHEFTWNYLAWGIGHGLGLAMIMQIGSRAKLEVAPRTAREYLHRAGGILLTLSYVAVLSAFATAGSLGDGIAILAALGRLP